MLALIPGISPLHTDVMAQKAGDIINVKPADEEKYFYAQQIPDEVFKRMQGRSFPKNCTVKRSELRYLRVLHINKNGKTQVGEMVCSKSISADLIDIFRKLYKARYPIERMVLVDDYDADDEKSMEANNTTCFNFRMITGSTTKVSKHGMGLAVDLNPFDNPYIKGKVIKPKGAKRQPEITRTSLPYRLFTEHGFRWGGAWKSLKDYQHFEK
jgi:hypothetical protein